ncbi:unnamed protein product [Linum trigynum]|uniref:Uncharacterized protein n=1 Tax=Linum trigynum TaxID=586398 RepID=A0AAV2CLR2_9ROSI
MVPAEGLQRVLAVGSMMGVPRVWVEGVEKVVLVGSLAEAEVQLEDVVDPLKRWLNAQGGGASLLACYFFEAFGNLPALSIRQEFFW